MVGRIHVTGQPQPDTAGQRARREQAAVLVGGLLTTSALAGRVGLRLAGDVDASVVTGSSRTVRRAAHRRRRRSTWNSPD